jgi:hypothetical protein
MAEEKPLQNLSSTTKETLKKAEGLKIKYDLKEILIMELISTKNKGSYDTFIGDNEAERLIAQNGAKKNIV